MASTLLLCFAGPLQSWGSRSSFSHRETDSEPTRSGVIGMLALALGQKSNVDQSLFTGLKMGVRVDQEGTTLTDYHTTRNVYKADGSRSTKQVCTLSYRDYLCDAVFLVGLESDNTALIDRLFAAVEHPHRTLTLGRYCCVNSRKIAIEVVEKPVLQALLQHPPLTEAEEDAQYRFIMETAPGQGTERQDVPISFEKRLFIPRWVTNQYYKLEV